MLEALDLRRINGLSGSPGSPFQHLEDFVASDACRPFRIISYQDFERVIRLALPQFMDGEMLRVRTCDWLDSGRLFWAGEHMREAFACAVVYARMRELAIHLPAQVTRYRLNPSGLHTLQEQYHALWMPPQAWINPGFMHLLLESDMPYARLDKLHADYQEVLLLSRVRKRSNALGLGLRKAGAFDASDWLAGFVAKQVAQVSA